jgi:hypothetical protein
MGSRAAHRPLPLVVPVALALLLRLSVWMLSKHLRLKAVCTFEQSFHVLSIPSGIARTLACS